jgi:large subunit ribosomal protein L15
MLTLNELHPAKGSNKGTVRVGRGQGNGNGKTCGRGQNGMGQRAGATNKAYFEGGQTPLTRRIPKRGFKPLVRKEYQIVNVRDLESLDVDVSEIDAQWLYDHGMVHSKDHPIKILGNGELSKSMHIKADAFSRSAREKIEKAKGKAEVITRA